MSVRAGQLALTFIFYMNENPNITIIVTLQEANQILAGLQELPAKICNPLAEKITKQANEQLNPNKTEKVDAELVE